MSQLASNTLSKIMFYFGIHYIFLQQFTRILGELSCFYKEWSCFSMGGVCTMVAVGASSRDKGPEKDKLCSLAVK